MTLPYKEVRAIKKWIHAEEIKENEMIQLVLHFNLQPEGEQAGLAADSTGIKYEGKFKFHLDHEILRHAKYAYLEAAKASSAGDEVTAVELYDDNKAGVAASLSITGASARKRSSDILANLTAGHEYHVRWNVTTASGTAGATFDAIGARLVIIVGVS